MDIHHVSKLKPNDGCALMCGHVFGDGANENLNHLRHLDLNRTVCIDFINKLPMLFLSTKDPTEFFPTVNLLTYVKFCAEMTILPNNNLGGLLIKSSFRHST